MNFRQLCTLLNSPRVQYLKWKNDEVYTTYIDLVAICSSISGDQEKELGTNVSQLVEKFIVQVKENFDIELTSEELGRA